MPKRVISLFSVEYMPRLLPIKFVGEPLCLSESLGHRKFLSRGYRDSQLIFFWPHSTEKFRGKRLQPSRKFRVSKFSMHGNGKSRLSAEISLSHKTKKVRGNHF